MSEATDYSSLAALSARHSLKRARVLYATNPQAVFIPSVDATIAQASLNRRRRRPKQARVVSGKGKDGSTALAIVNEDSNNTTLQMKPLESERSAIPSSALTLHGTKDEAKPKNTGILVVSWDWKPR